MDAKAFYPTDFKTRRLPIEHVVVIWQENRTVDHLYSDRPGVGDLTLPIDSDPPRVGYQATPGHANYLSMRYPKLNEYRSRLVRQQVPLLYEWPELCAALCDNYFVEKNGPSDWNHLAAATGNSDVIGKNGQRQTWINNPPKYKVLQAAGRAFRDDPDVPPPISPPALPVSLEKQGFTWGSFGESTFHLINTPMKNGPLNQYPNLQMAQDFAPAARMGNLPTVSWVMPPFDKTGHAPESQADGMMWVAEQLQAIVDGGLWEKTAVFVAWDDSGGFADHVPAPDLERLAQNPDCPDRLGKRVPCLVISPYAKAGYLSSQAGGIKSHRSLYKFVNEWLGLPPLDAAREAQVGSMWDCFDFDQKPSAPPRTTLRDGELKLERSFTQRLWMECQRIPGKFEANILFQEDLLVYALDRTLGPRHKVRQAITRSLGLDDPNVGKLSRQGVPSTKLGYALFTPGALLLWPFGIVIDAVIAVLLAHGHTLPMDPHGSGRNNAYVSQLQRNAQLNQSLGIMAPETLVKPNAWSQITRDID